MVLISEFENFVWLATSSVVMIAGYVIYAYSQGSFLKLAVGMPVGIVGLTVVLFKIHEIILTVVRPSRLKAICVFCQQHENQKNI